MSEASVQGRIHSGAAGPYPAGRHSSAQNREANRQRSTERQDQRPARDVGEASYHTQLIKKQAQNDEQGPTRPGGAQAGDNA